MALIIRADVELGRGHFDAARAHLEAHGIEKMRVRDHVVSQSIYVDDPDGNMVELFVDADPSTWRDTPETVANSRPLSL